jgi:exonuclease SbcC
MIRRVLIKNFQSLVNARLELGSFTVVVGESDLGKSAIIRAMRALATNQVGQSFINREAKSTGIQIDTDDGTVAWTKGQSAEYKIKTPEWPTAQTFDKTGRIVPDEVQTLLQLSGLQIGDDTFLPNFSDQFDLPFLVDASPITRARLLGELSGVNILYLAIAEAKRLEQAAKRLQTTRQSDLEKAKGRLKVYDSIPNLDAKLKRAETSVKAEKAVSTELEALASSIQTAQRHQQDIAALQAKYNSLDAVLPLPITEAEEAQRTIQAITQAIEAVTQQQTTLSALAHRLEVLEPVKTFDWPQLESSRQVIVQLASDIELLVSNRNTRQTFEQSLSDLSDQLEETQTELAKFKTCPVCEQPLNGASNVRLQTVAMVNGGH